MISLFDTVSFKRNPLTGYSRIVKTEEITGVYGFANICLELDCSYLFKKHDIVFRYMQTHEIATPLINNIKHRLSIPKNSIGEQYGDTLDIVYLPKHSFIDENNETSELLDATSYEFSCGGSSNRIKLFIKITSLHKGVKHLLKSLKDLIFYLGYNGIILDGCDFIMSDFSARNTKIVSIDTEYPVGAYAIARNLEYIRLTQSFNRSMRWYKDLFLQ